MTLPQGARRQTRESDRALSCTESDDGDMGLNIKPMSHSLLRVSRWASEVVKRPNIYSGALTYCALSCTPVHTEVTEA